MSIDIIPSSQETTGAFATPQESLEQAFDTTELFADITASSSALQQTWTSVTQSWITSMLDTFNQTNAIIWSMVWPSAALLRKSGLEESVQAGLDTAETLNEEAQDALQY